MAKNVMVLKHFESPKEAGVYHRLVCLTGGNKGESFILTGSRVIMGRSEKADIRLSDAKASREHVEITKVGDNWVATDLGSQNGVLVNDKKIKQETLKEGDKLIIGQTVFKFAKVEVSSKQVKEEDESEAKSKKTMIPLLVLVLVFVAAFLFDEKDPQKPVEQSTTTMRGFEDISNEYVGSLKKKQAKEDKQNKDKLNSIYKRGLREFREGNYFRAIHEFNLALIISPGDAQAEYYLRKTKENLDKSIESLTEQAKRDETSLKYNSAIISYCSIIRLLYSVPDDSRHKNAERQIKELELKLGQEQGETDCLKKQRTN
jgi:pSer/pThr/pTyr-binding forkhead associated (FHA) protein